MPRDRVKGFIVPRDPYQCRENAFTAKNKWSRLRDCFTGRGPDLSVGCVDGYNQRPSKAEWSMWGHDGARRPPRFLYADRRHDDRYDLKIRRYRPWSPEVWGGVEYCSGCWRPFYGVTLSIKSSGLMLRRTLGALLDTGTPHDGLDDMYV